ncbi:hypothetical protein EW145_g3589 [Phellinidium pouzarii]|uniref:Cytochrome b5 heme-binding domain-containing protein n=1 Tax=Phellinidium pouzarii TaxID=167371 RepID=A0A4S4L728_9AGAM|nr:hypothetical protein EW145_g3589 [Phellinidium pouzarii]
METLSSLTTSQLLLLSLLSLPAFYIIKRAFSVSTAVEGADKSSADDKDAQPKSIMQPENLDLSPPSDAPYTLDALKAFDGSDPAKPIYVSIKGTVFDVSKKEDLYGRGGSYNIFAGKDGSKGLGMSSLKEEDAVPDYSDLSESDMKVLNDWHGFFSKRYNIVGRVVDLPGAPEEH